MSNLQKFKAKICYTASGVLIHRDKTLLIKHGKLGIWLPPGGHIDPNELPHVAAEREFYEETGVKVRSLHALKPIRSTETEYLPTPFAINLHWISQDNFHNRINSKHPQQRIKTRQWPKGCEQHVTFIYLVKPAGNINPRLNSQETDGIDWFTLSDLDRIKTLPDVRDELKLAFSLKPHS